jgi:protein gp37
MQTKSQNQHRKWPIVVPEQSGMRCHHELLLSPLDWGRPCSAYLGDGDLFDKSVPVPFVRHVLVTIAKSPAHHFKLKTSDIQRARAVVSECFDGWIQDGWLALGSGEVPWPLGNLTINGEQLEIMGEVSVAAPHAMKQPAFYAV